MSEEKKSLNAVAEELTPFNREFIFQLVHGKSASGQPLTVYEAYQNAGGDGTKHAAYQLKSRLEREIMAAEVNRGASKADIFKQIADLMNLPVVDKNGNAAAGISVTNKIKLLQVAIRAHEAVEPQAPKISSFTINMAPAKAEGAVIDAEVVKGDEHGRSASGTGA